MSTDRCVLHFFLCAVLSGGVRTNAQSAGAANAALIFLTFIVSIPGMILPTNRFWLKLHGYMVFISAIFTLLLGLSIWFDTLTTRTRLLEVWDNVPPAEQSILQTTV